MQKTLTVACVLVVFYTLGIGAAYSEQPPCDELSRRNPNAMIHCNGQQWFDGRLSGALLNSANSETSTNSPHIQQNSDSSNVEINGLARQQTQMLIKYPLAYMSYVGPADTGITTGLLIVALQNKRAHFGERLKVKTAWKEDSLKTNVKKGDESLEFYFSCMEGGYCVINGWKSSANWFYQGDSMEALGMLMGLLELPNASDG